MNILTMTVAGLHVVRDGESVMAAGRFCRTCGQRLERGAERKTH